MDRNVRRLGAFCSQLAQEAAVVGPDELLDQAAMAVELEDVDEVHDDARSVGLKRACGRVCERADERAFNPCLARHGVSVDNDDAAADAAVIEGVAHRLEVFGQACVVGVEAVGAVEREVLGVEVGVDLLLVLARNLEFAGSQHTGIALGRILSRQHERAETDVLRQTLAEARRTVEVLTEITTAVERSDDLGVGVAILAHRLGMVVELLGLDGELLRRAPATASAEPPTQWELTLGADPLATLRVRADRALAEPELEIATGSGQAITLQLARERAGLQAALRLHSEFLNELLVGPVADTQRLQERAALLGLDLRHPRHVVTIGVHGANAPGGRRPPVRRGTFAAVERRLHAAFPGSIIVHQQGEAVGLLATGEFDPAKVRSGLRRALETDEGDQALAAGLGRLCHRIDEYATSYTEAALGLDIACRRPRPGELLSPDDLGLYGILGHGSARGSLESIVENTLGPLVAADDKGGSEYVKTLEAFLASDRHLERTAAALHIHVNTVRYRLGKIQDDLGVDLHDVDTRFLLELALRVQAALHRH
jgi:sugar diacid utilization regulator